MRSPLILERGPDCQQRLLERRQIVFHRVPDNLAIYPLILVAQDVADTGDVLPAHVLMLRFEFTAEVAASFGNHLDAALDSRPQNPGTFEIAKILARDSFFDPRMLSSMSWMRSRGDRAVIKKTASPQLRPSCE